MECSRENRWRYYYPMAHDAVMFLCHCPSCGRRELRGPRSLSTTTAGAFVAACRACGATVPVAGGTVTARPAAA